jgi:hypothetical protein
MGLAYATCLCALPLRLDYAFTYATYIRALRMGLVYTPCLRALHMRLAHVPSL